LSIIFPPVLRVIEGSHVWDELSAKAEEEFTCSTHSWSLQFQVDESHLSVEGREALESDGDPYLFAKAFLR
jgi:hypothetical protein